MKARLLHVLKLSTGSIRVANTFGSPLHVNSPYELTFDFSPSSVGTKVSFTDTNLKGDKKIKIFFSKKYIPSKAIAIFNQIDL